MTNHNQAPGQSPAEQIGLVDGSFIVKRSGGKRETGWYVTSIEDDTVTIVNPVLLEQNKPCKKIIPVSELLSWQPTVEEDNDITVPRAQILAIRAQEQAATEVAPVAPEVVEEAGSLAVESAVEPLPAPNPVASSIQAQIDELAAGKGVRHEVFLEPVGEVEQTEVVADEAAVEEAKPDEIEKTLEEIIADAMRSPEDFIKVYDDEDTPRDVKYQMGRLVEAWREASSVDEADKLWQALVVPKLEKLADSNLGELSQRINSISQHLEEISEGFKLVSDSLYEGGVTLLAERINRVKSLMGGGASSAAEYIHSSTEPLEALFDNARNQGLSAINAQDESTSRLRQLLINKSTRLEGTEATQMFDDMQKQGVSTLQDAKDVFMKKGDSNRRRARQDAVESALSFSSVVERNLTDTEMTRSLLLLEQDIKMYIENARQSRYDAGMVADIARRLQAVQHDFEIIGKYAKVYSPQAIKELIQHGS